MREDAHWIAQRLAPLDIDLEYDPALSFIPAAVLVALVPREHGLSVLLTRRSDALRSHTGQIALPGGRCEPGETPPATALREAHEEIGLDPGAVRLLGLGDPLHTRSGYLVAPVVGLAAADAVLTANPDEVAEIFETPFAYLMNPENYEVRIMTLPTGEQRSVYVVEHAGRSIWGVTAAILHRLHERLHGARDV
jgi:8-oxo-dGTP pyrophosphatase MutT (NUDIX family)